MKRVTLNGVTYLQTEDGVLCPMYTVGRIEVVPEGYTQLNGKLYPILPACKHRKTVPFVRKCCPKPIQITKCALTDTEVRGLTCMECTNVE